MEQFTEKKIAILETTLELIREHGFHGTPISMVVKNSGVAAGTIYHHFESKDRLICELFQYVSDKLLAAATEGDDETAPYKERFLNLWKNLYIFHTKNPNVPVFFDQYINSPYFEKKPKGEHNAYHRYIFDFIRQGISQGHLKPVNPEILGVLLSSTAITSFKIQSLGKIEAGAAELEQIVQIIWDGVTAS
ncbi:MAG: TetR/AcrR family transcriptional regulator [Bacteroidetes bacterium]|nr:TetR/AcrR family transcriptional regulator [Bacteroidota bacterium]